MDLQDRICAALEAEELGDARRFREDRFLRDGGGLSRTRVLSAGDVLESAAVNFSHTVGVSLPEAATARRPELAGRAYEATSVSLIVHPRNPYAPTCHANFRAFFATKDGAAPAWWFGGGFDLTPFYGFDADAIHWHQTARDALAPFGDELYPRFKQACDEYFFLPHRGEPRGIGGVFFDDLQFSESEGGFARALGLTRAVGEAFLPAYLPILARRKGTPHGLRERDFQLYRRGRYVEFNLLYDRGTRFGLQAGTRTESILASLPPVVTFAYAWTPTPGTPEALLYERFLVPRDWAAG